jgi:2-polyprenyl-3-methyl-5-hydroxy-6-metoxy-1,4-benzoquinol methylase
MREEGLHRLKELPVGKNRLDFIVMHYLINDLRHAISRYSQGELLDVGCGNKPYEVLFKDKISSYLGCDVVQSDLNKVDVICEATSLTFDNYRFDTVFSTQVIEHVGDPFRMLEEINRVLKKDGILILSAPFCWELHEEPFDFFRYSKYGLKSMIEKNGFEILELKANGGKWAAIIQMNLNILYSSFKRKGWFCENLKRDIY